MPKVAKLLENADEGLLAFYRFPGGALVETALHQPAGAVSREVGIFPDDFSVLRLVGSLLIEQNDEWLISRRYLSEESRRGKGGGRRVASRLKELTRSYTTTAYLTVAVGASSPALLAVYLGIIGYIGRHLQTCSGPRCLRP